MSHLGYADFSISRSGACGDGEIFTREVIDLSVDYDRLFEHKTRCTMAPSASIATTIEAQRSDGETFNLDYQFATATVSDPAVQIQDAVTTPRDTINGLFTSFADDYLVDELGLSPIVRALVEPIVTQIGDAAWTNLVDPQGRYAVTSQRVSYVSRTPRGDGSAALTGLVAFPQSPVPPRDEIIVLMHSTGVTPSDLEPSNAWFVLANLFASLGYLVVAPDNWGRGGTSAEEETYLLGTRTAANALDLIRAVAASVEYQSSFDAANPTVIIVGYSQGGHSAMALWHTLRSQALEFSVGRVYAGGAPHNLYATVKGAVEFVDGSCNGGPYCRYVDDDTSVPFVTERILPGYLAYQSLGLSLVDAAENRTLTPAFVNGFLTNDVEFDALKVALQQSSYTNFEAGSVPGAPALVELFHSGFDRLVAAENSVQLSATFGAAVNYRTDACNGLGYEAVFNATDIVGISHALCGFEMLDDVFEELR